MAGDATIGTATFRIVRELDAGDLYLVEGARCPTPPPVSCSARSPAAERPSWSARST
nr:hypothetical protein [Tessaracoccus coleopterorum]